MPSLVNPWVLLAIVLALGASAYEGFRLGGDHEIAAQAKTQALIAVVKEEAQQGAAEAIGKIDIKQTTINRKIETITHENTVYRDCVVTPDVAGLLDASRANGDGADALSRSVVPAAGASKSP